jgi:hypothetical protein
MRYVAIVVVASGCISYSRGSFVDYETFPGKRVALGGCLDLSVAMVEDNTATGRIVQFTFGNGCRQRVTVDLGSVRAYTTDGGGCQRWLTAYDPNHELVPLAIEPLWSASERIEYNDDNRDAPQSICVDVGGVDGGVARSERWVCMAQGEVR